MTADPLVRAPTVLQLEHVSKVYRLKRTRLRQPRSVLHAVRDASFEVHEGETVGVVGESGSGKSTLGRMAMALSTPSSGLVRIDGVDAAEARGSRLRALRRTVQGIFQDPTAALNPRRSIFASIAEPLLASGMSVAAVKERVAELLEMVGLDPSRADERPRRFSGGQRQRVVIARALATLPRVIVADEPVSALDVSVQAQILNLFRDLQRTHRLSSIFISHDLAVISYVADRVVVMYLGDIVETGSVRDVLDAPAHPYTVALRDAAAAGENHEALQTTAALSVLDLQAQGCPFRSRCPLVMPVCETDRPALSPYGEGRQVACHAVVPA